MSESGGVCSSNDHELIAQPDSASGGPTPTGTASGGQSNTESKPASLPPSPLEDTVEPAPQSNVCSSPNPTSGPEPKDGPVPSTSVAMLKAASTINSEGEAISRLARAREAFTSAKKEVQRADHNLDVALAKIGVGLTPEERQQFASNFHKGESLQLEQATGELEQACSDPRLDSASTRDSTWANEIFRSHAALASSAHPEVALAWAKRLVENPCSPSARALANTSDDFESKLAEEVVGPALENSGSSALSREGGDVEKAIVRLKDLASPFLKAKVLQSGAKALIGAPEALRAAEEAATEGNFSKLASIGKKVGGMGPIARGLAAAGIAFAGVKAAQSGRQGDYLAMAKEIAKGGAKSMELLCGAGHLLATAAHGRGLVAEKTLLSVAKSGELMAKLIPGVALAANGLSAALHIRAAREEGSVALGIAITGDMIALTGSAMAVLAPLAGPGAPVALALGETIDVTGVALSASGDLLDSAVRDAAVRDGITRTLRTMGWSGQMSAAYGKFFADTRLGKLAKAGLTPAQIQKAIQQFPEMSDNDPLHQDAANQIVRRIQDGDIRL